MSVPQDILAVISHWDDGINGDRRESVSASGMHCIMVNINSLRAYFKGIPELWNSGPKRGKFRENGCGGKYRVPAFATAPLSMTGCYVGFSRSFTPDVRPWASGGCVRPHWDDRGRSLPHFPSRPRALGKIRILYIMDKNEAVHANNPRHRQRIPAILRRAKR